MELTPGTEIQRSQLVEQLFRAFCQAEDLMTLVEFMAQIWGNPLHITDVTYKLLASSNYSNVNDIAWTDTDELGYLSTLILTEAKNRHVVKVPEKESDRIYFIWRSKLSTYPMLVYYVYHGKRLLGYLCMLCVTGVPDEEFISLFGLLSDLVAKFLVMENKKHQDGEIPVYEDILINLITMTEQNQDVIRNRATAIGLHAYSHFSLVNLSTNTHHRVLRDVARSAFSYARVFYYLQQVMILIPHAGNTPQGLTPFERKTLSQILDSTDTYACVSDEFYDLASLQTAFKRNMAILELSDAYRKRPVQERLYTVLDHLGDRIMEYDSFKIVGLAYRLIATAAPEEILGYVNRPVRILDQYDRETNGQLLQTLLLFVAQNQSYIRVSELMHTHKNTISYRMKKIQGLVSIDLTDGNAAAAIYHSGVLLQTYKLLESR